MKTTLSNRKSGTFPQKIYRSPYIAELEMFKETFPKLLYKRTAPKAIRAAGISLTRFSPKKIIKICFLPIPDMSHTPSSSFLNRIVKSCVVIIIINAAKNIKTESLEMPFSNQSTSDSTVSILFPTFPPPLGSHILQRSPLFFRRRLHKYIRRRT